MGAASGALRQAASQTPSGALARIGAQLSEANKRIQLQAAERQELQEQTGQLMQLQQELREFLAAAEQLVAQQMAHPAQAWAQVDALSGPDEQLAPKKENESDSVTSKEVCSLHLKRYRGVSAISFTCLRICVQNEHS